MSLTEIYLDNAATTWTSPEVRRAMRDFQDRQLGNASSLHQAGVRAATLVEGARASVARKLNATPEEILFTSGGTESNNLALRGVLDANGERGSELIISAIEHSSVFRTAQWLSTQGHKVSLAPVNGEGVLDYEALEKLITPATTLVSVVHANNEVGTLQDLERLSRLCHSRRVTLHLDACQSFCKEEINVSKVPVDLISLSAHKIHGPTGVGALYVRDGVKLSPIVFGGNQERGLRSGTYHTEGIVGLGAAVETFDEESIPRMRQLRDEVLKELSSLPMVRVNGAGGLQRLCNNINISLVGFTAKTVMFELSKRGIFVSTGSACASGKKDPSHVLLAMGKSEELARECLRISLSRYTTGPELERFLDALKEILHG